MRRGLPFSTTPPLPVCAYMRVCVRKRERACMSVGVYMYICVYKYMRKRESVCMYSSKDVCGVPATYQSFGQFFVGHSPGHTHGHCHYDAHKEKERSLCHSVVS